MKLTSILLFFCLLAGTSCERKLSAAEVKQNLEKAMSGYLQKDHRPGTPPLHFEMVDVSYTEDTENYICDFKVKLYRPDGTDTTGTIRTKVSRDFSKVSR